MTSLMKNPLVVGSGAIALVGIGVYVYQLMFGLGITGMNNSTSWGLYLTCFMFFVGLSAGGLIVASSGRRKRQLEGSLAGAGKGELPQRAGRVHGQQL